MKTKLLLITCCSILFVTTSSSQNLFGIKAGVQLSKMSGFEGNPNGFLTSLQLKATGIFPVGDMVALTPSLGYSGKGYGWKGIDFTDQYGTPMGTGNVNGLFNYIQLTVPISYRIANNPNKEYYFGLGPYYAYAVSGKGRIKHISIPNAEDSWDLFSDDFYKRSDAGIVIEISTRRSKRYLASFNLDIGLANVSNGDGNKLKQLSAGLSLGYLFNAK